MECSDYYLRNVSDTTFGNMIKDTQRNIYHNYSVSEVKYYSVGTTKYLNWTIGFGKSYTSEDS